MKGQTSFLDEIIVDSFAGGGGASTGIELATGRVVTIAINHDADAILMHKTNHPYTEHYRADVWEINPVEVCRGRPVGLMWASPDCKHFSKAKGAALVDRKIRGLAWVVLKWAALVRPRVIILENVEEFQTWGPVKNGKPIKSKAGKTFRKWKQQLLSLGYSVEHRELVACDYGAPTSRKRFVLVARCDGRPIAWPEPTHGDPNSEAVKSGKLKPWHTAWEVIEELPVYSIFDSKQEIWEKHGVRAVRPLAEKTLRRVIRGVDQFTIRSGKPFLISYHDERSDAARVNGLEQPLPTVDASNRYGLVSAYLCEYYGNGNPIPLNEPMRTITSHDREAICAAHIAEFKGNDKGQALDAPLRTITASAGEFAVVGTQLVEYSGGDFGWWPQIRDLLNRHCGYSIKENEILLLKINGTEYYIRDIFLRMLRPRELYKAMGFPADYIIDHDYEGNEYGKGKQVARCGNAVCPPMAEAVVRANLPDWCGGKIESMEQLRRAVSA